MPVPRGFRFMANTPLLAAAFLAAFSPAAEAAAGARGSLFPQTPSGIHLEMVFNYDLSQSQLSEETGVVDLVWGSSYATLPAGMYNSAYIPYSEDNFTYSVAWYQANHPDWLEYQCDQMTLAYEYGSDLAPLDIANPAVQQFQWQNWVDAPLAAGYQGIAVDTMALGNAFARCGHFDLSGTWVQQYTGQYRDPQFVSDTLAWEAATYAHIHGDSATATMQANVSYDFGASLADNQALMGTTDLLFDERGFTNWGVKPNWNYGSEWTTIVQQIAWLQSQGICYMTNGEEPGLTADITLAERLWIMANYLLVRNNCTYMYISGYLANGEQDYGRLITFKQYGVAIGSPTGAMTQTQTIWERPYSGGWTLVNPNNKVVTVTLPSGQWVNVDGAALVSPLKMQAHSGQVLLPAP